MRAFPFVVMNDILRAIPPLVSHQAVVMNHLMEGLPKVTGHNHCSLIYQPFFIFWFMGQISRALTSWSIDNSLIAALDVGKAIARPTECLMSLFPCDGAFEVVFASGNVADPVLKLSVSFIKVSTSNWWLLALAPGYPHHLLQRFPLGLSLL